MTNLTEKPFALIGVHVGGTNAPQLRQIMDKEKLPWRSFADAGNAGAGPIATKWNLSATPTFYVIDHRGVIRYKYEGRTSGKVIDKALQELLQECKRDVARRS